MFPRLGWLSIFFLACAFAGACAEGASSNPPGEFPANPALGIPQPVCGNGMRETGELCDCPVTATMMCEAPAGVTCESLGKGMGTVYCAPKVCMYITEFCSGSMNPGGAGQGSSAGRGG